MNGFVSILAILNAFVIGWNLTCFAMFGAPLCGIAVLVSVCAAIHAITIGAAEEVTP